MIETGQVLQIIKNKLTTSKFEHSVQVAESACRLAGLHGVNEQKAYLAGLLHDYAKGLPEPQLLKIAQENGLISHEIERQLPDLLHAPVGAWLIKRELSIEDADILEAVSYHTLGSLEMSDLSKIIYIADMIEPGRNYPELDILKDVSARCLDEGMLYGLESTIKYCLEKQRILHPRTVEVRNFYLLLVKIK